MGEFYIESDMGTPLLRPPGKMYWCNIQHNCHSLYTLGLRWLIAYVVVLYTLGVCYDDQDEQTLTARPLV